VLTTAPLFSKGPVLNDLYLRCRCVLIPHGKGTGAQRRPAARAAHRFDIEIQLLRVASQAVAVHAQLSRSSDLIPIHVSENCNEEGFLKFTDGLGV